jgi:formate-dependent nitrite reductase cytochrome c552 subunit
MPATSERPTDDAILAKLDALSEAVSAGFADIHSRVDYVTERVEAAAKAAKHAQSDATEAMRRTSEVEKSQSDTVRAMQAHADNVARSATAIVKANDEQTPILQSTLDIATWLKRSAPVLMAAAAVVGGVVWSFLAPILAGLAGHH